MHIGHAALLCVSFLACDSRETHAPPIARRVHAPIVTYAGALTKAVEVAWSYACGADTPSSHEASRLIMAYAAAHGVTEDSATSRKPCPLEPTRDPDDLISFVLGDGSPELRAAGVQLACSLCERERLPCLCGGSPCEPRDLTGDKDLPWGTHFTCSRIELPEGKTLRWGSEVRQSRWSD